MHEQYNNTPFSPLFAIIHRNLFKLHSHSELPDFLITCLEKARNSNSGNYLFNSAKDMYENRARKVKKKLPTYIIQVSKTREIILFD